MKAIPIILLALMLTPLNVTGQEALPDPGITPDSMFYGLEKAFEKVQLTLARDEVSKARLRLELANERIAEGKSMVEKGKPEYLPDLVEEYEENLGKSQELAEAARAKGKQTFVVDELVAQATSVHVEVLEDVLEKVPEQAKPAIEKAITSSARGQEESLVRLGEVVPERSAELYLSIAEKRLIRARIRAEAGDSEEAEDLVEEYNRKADRSLEMLKKAKTMGRDVTEVQEKVLAATSTHQEVLQDVYDMVPEEAKEAIERAMEVSTRGKEEALQALNIALPPQAERARAGKQGDGDRGEIPEVARGLPITVPAPETQEEDDREEKEERVPETETPTPTETLVTTPKPETPAPTEPPVTTEPETPETPTQAETPGGQRGMS
jgi:hypothetical protein